MRLTEHEIDEQYYAHQKEGQVALNRAIADTATREAEKDFAGFLSDFEGQKPGDHGLPHDEFYAKYHTSYRDKLYDNFRDWMRYEGVL